MIYVYASHKQSSGDEHLCAKVCRQLRSQPAHRESGKSSVRRGQQGVNMNQNSISRGEQSAATEVAPRSAVRVAR